MLYGVEDRYDGVDHIWDWIDVMQPWSQPLLWKGAGGDPYFGNVVLLAGWDGTNGATTWNDESPKLHGAGVFAGSAQITTTNPKFGVGSLTDTGSGGGVQWANSADWQLGSGQFTIECWVYAASFPGSAQFLIAEWNASVPTFSWAFWLNSSIISWNTSTTGSDNNADMNWAGLTTSVWHHVAVDFDGVKYRLYVDGSTKATFSTLRNLNPFTYPLGIGCDSSPAHNFTFNGQIDEVRITKGVARYATDTSFAVPTAAFPRHG